MVLNYLEYKKKPIKHFVLISLMRLKASKYYLF